MPNLRTRMTCMGQHAVGELRREVQRREKGVEVLLGMSHTILTCGRESIRRGCATPQRLRWQVRSLDLRLGS